jgi:ATP-dependent Clp protease ATP-binding subunit ClpA
MFERFTERARQVVVLAQDEARTLRHNYIGTEHLLLGLLREQDGLAARVLDSFAVTVEEVRAQVVGIVGEGDEVTTGQIPFTPRAKKVLELSLREARAMRHGYIGTEHILLGLVRENEGVAARILLDFGADAETISNEVAPMLSGPDRPSEEGPGDLPPDAPRDLVEGLGRVRAAKEEAIEAQDFERAVELREEERRIVLAARRARGSFPRPGLMRRGVADYREPERGRLAVVVGSVVAAIGFPLGLLVGWLIWG